MPKVLLLLLPMGCDAPSERAHRPEAWAFADGAALEVRVEDDAGAPVADAWVTLGPDGRDARTDADGLARFTSLAPGDRRAVVAASGFETARVDVDGDALRVVLSRPTGPALVGEVTGPDGAPVPGAVVHVDGAVAATADGGGVYLVEDLPPGHHDLRFTDPAGRLAAWTASGVRLPERGDVVVDAALPGRPPADATYVGSTTCLFCHAGADDAGEDWFRSAHARATRAPRALAGTPLADAFTGGLEVPLAPDVPGGAVLLDADAGAWTAELVDGEGRSTGPLPVVEVYGGHRIGAALSVRVDGDRALLPVLWSTDGGFVVDRADGWYQNGALTAPGPRVDFDLQCAGCHATGHALVEDDGFSLAPASPRGAVERRIGCEACHGPGSAHIASPDRAASTVHNPGRMPPGAALETCARCHERIEPGEHPFTVDPPWPVQPSGAFVVAGDAHGGTPAPDHWLTAPGSRVRADQVGELRLSPHRRDGGWSGRCEDCHDPHGSAHPAQLRRVDDGLCTSCHQERFPTRASREAHAAHAIDGDGWGAGTCVSCHMPRSAHGVRPDPLTGAGQGRSHGLWPFHPDDALAELDDAGVDALPPHQLPVGACVDCHLTEGVQGGDPGARSTYEALLPVFQELWP